MIVQPLIGYYSDRCTSRFGRRRPFIAAGTVFILISVFLIGYAADIGHAAGDDLSRPSPGHHRLRRRVLDPRRRQQHAHGPLPRPAHRFVREQPEEDTCLQFLLLLLPRRRQRSRVRRWELQPPLQDFPLY
ncbi:unnamed protein product [Linum trigynum]|uniref:Sucrose transporter n=1 Tax=Linum trigynum TaxID=586398 RepID=A0AAV2G022_9ROSI